MTRSTVSELINKKYSVICFGDLRIRQINLGRINYRYLKMFEIGYYGRPFCSTLKKFLPLFCMNAHGYTTTAYFLILTYYCNSFPNLVGRQCR